MLFDRFQKLLGHVLTKEIEEDTDLFILGLFDIFTILVVIISFLSVFTLLANLFSAWLVGLLLFVCTTFFGALFYGQFQIKLPKLTPRFYLVLAFLGIFIALRMPPSNYIVGGQDEGVYVNVAAYYQHHGRAKPFDGIFDSLLPEERDFYNETNMLNDDQQMLGVYSLNKLQPNRAFEFFIIHPLWMALFGEIFGIQNAIFSLLFYSVLSLISIKKLASLLFNTELAGVFASIIVIFNPFHVFFSKFPVTEILSLFFLTSSTYFFILGLREIVPQRQKFYFALHGLLLGVQAFNHIATIFIIPLLWFLLIFLNKDILKAYWATYTIVIICFLTSIVVGYFVTYSYVARIYTQLFSIQMVQHAEQFVLITSIVCCIAPFVIFRLNNLFNSLKIRLEKLVIFGVGIFCGAWTYKFLKIVTSRSIINENGWWETATTLFNQTTIKVFFLMLSPVAFILFILAIKRYVLIKTESRLPIVLIVSFFYFSLIRLYESILQGYNYYYSRYLLSELFPIAVVIIAGYLAYLVSKKRHGLVVGMLIGIVTWNLFFSAWQFGKTEMHLVAPALDKITNNIDMGDLVVYNQFEDNIDARTPLLPLRYYYNLPTIESKDYIETLTMLPSLFDSYHDIFVLSKQPIKAEHLTLLDTAQFSISHFEHIREASIPKLFIQPVNYKIYLYILDKTEW